MFRSLNAETEGSDPRITETLVHTAFDDGADDNEEEWTGSYSVITLTWGRVSQRQRGRRRKDTRNAPLNNYCCGVLWDGSASPALITWSTQQLENADRDGKEIK